MTLRLISDPIVRTALLEDVGRAGDLTTDAVIPAHHRSTAHLVARAPGIIAGCTAALSSFEILDPHISLELHSPDGTRVEAGQAIATVRGLTRTILTAERTALNLLCHLSGIATSTRRYVDAIAHTDCVIVCTRKTTPGLRVLEKDAVRAGGGQNHRFGLDDAILIKDNHLAAIGSATAALAAVRQRVGHLVRIEIEVDTLDQLREVLDCGADIILLDNMSLEQLREAVAITHKRAVLEASGSMRLDRVAAVAETGVDLISVGALTHSTNALDIGLDLEG